jgi:hypothetical protein
MEVTAAIELHSTKKIGTIISIPSKTTEDPVR